MAWLQNGIDKSRDGYVRLVTPIARRGFIALLLVGGFAVATGGIGSLVPSGFLPDEDQGAFMAEVQLPDASSTNRTLKSIEEVEKVIAGRPWMQSMFTVSGYSLLDGLNLPNRGLVVVELKPFAERNDKTLTVFHALKEVNAAFAQIASANVFAFNLPPIMGLGNSSGFEFVVQSLAGAPPVDLAAVARGMMVSAQEVPELANVFTTYAASTPQINLKLDRERAQALGVTISDIFSAMQTTLGGTYTNDFNLFGRVWQVKVQADAPDRGNVNDVFRVRVRSSNGELLPLQAVANIELITAPSSIVRYNNLRSVVLNGAPAPGYSSGQAIGAMERLAKSTLPAGYGFEWTGTALQEKAASGQTGFILALAVLFAYLFLVGLYESTAIPIAALLSVVVGLFGAMLALYISGLDNNIFAQIGIVVLIALAAKNAILIIEFAMEERAHGKDIVTRGDHGGGPALPRRDDDVVRLHPGPGAAGHRLGRGCRHPARRRHRGVRRHDRRLDARHLRHPRPVRRLPDLPREGEGHRAASRRRSSTRSSNRMARPRDRCQCQLKMIAMSPGMPPG